MTFCQIDDILDPRIACMPFSDYCDPLIHNRAHWDALTDSLLDNLCPIVVRCLFNDLPLNDERFTLYNQAKWHGTDLQPDVDVLWQHIDESSRRAIRKARKAGVEVRVAESKEELRRFYDLHVQIRKYKYHLLAQPFQMFEHLWEQFVEQQNGALMVAVQDGTIIGGIYLLGWQDTIYYKFNASDTTNLSYRPNDLLVWESMIYAREQGYTRWDFGLSDSDQEGLVRYKRKFAHDERTISFLRRPGAGLPTSRETQLRGLLNNLTTLFVDESVPDHITTQAGDMLYRYFT
jgi:lipid II:glycine glycyltransferase (peptidoglycan interpeptide bridge formation enzyme)